MPPVNPNSSSNSRNTNIDDENTEMEDEDVVEITQPFSGTKRNWNTSEDEALISAFLNVSTDAAVSTNQRRGALWSRVKSSFDLARIEKPRQIGERTLKMLNSRFQRISQAVSLWVSCVEIARKQNRSGQSEEDILADAREAYPGNFNFMSCWVLLKRYPKYEELLVAYADKKAQPFQPTEDFRTQYRDPITPGESTDQDSGGSGKRIRLNEGWFSTGSEGGEEVATRPQGIKAAKRNKGKGKSQETTSGDYASMTETLTTMANRLVEPEFFWERLEFSKKKEDERKVEAQRRDADKEKRREMRRAALQEELDHKTKMVQIEEQNSKRNLLNSLLQTPNLDARMENMKNQLLSELGF